MHVTGTNVMSGRTGITTSAVVPTGGIRYRSNIAEICIGRFRTESSDSIHSSGKDNGKRPMDNRYANAIAKHLTAHRGGNASATPARRIGAGGTTDGLLRQKGYARAADTGRTITANSAAIMRD